MQSYLTQRNDFSGGNSRCISRQHRRVSDKRPFVPRGMPPFDVSCEADQTRVVGELSPPQTLPEYSKCYAILLLSSQGCRVWELILILGASTVWQDLSRQMDVSVHHPSTREAQAGRHGSQGSGENCGACRPRCALCLHCLWQGSCGAGPSASGTLTSSVKSHRVVVKFKHRMYVKILGKLWSTRQVMLFSL